MQGVFVEEGTGTVFGNMTASTAGLVQSRKERVLPLATFHLLDGSHFLQLQISALMPDAGQRVIAAFANGPDDKRDRFARAFDVDGRILQTRPRHEQERTKRGI